VTLCLSKRFHGSTISSERKVAVYQLRDLALNTLWSVASPRHTCGFDEVVSCFRPPSSTLVLLAASIAARQTSFSAIFPIPTIPNHSERRWRHLAFHIRNCTAISQYSGRAASTQVIGRPAASHHVLYQDQLVHSKEALLHCINDCCLDHKARGQERPEHMVKTPRSPRD
jgi:hypothetical protein